MTRKEERAARQAAAIAITGAFGAFAIPALINSRDTVALFAALALAISWGAWAVSFVLTMAKEPN